LWCHQLSWLSKVMYKIHWLIRFDSFIPSLCCCCESYHQQLSSLDSLLITRATWNIKKEKESTNQQETNDEWSDNDLTTTATSTTMISTNDDLNAKTKNDEVTKNDNRHALTLPRF
jgi:protein subunit release factor B